MEHDENREEVAEPEKNDEPEPAELKSRISELERTLTEKESEIAGLKQQSGELEERCRGLETSLAGAVNGYRSLVVKTNPEVPEELLNGDGIEAIDVSLQKARDLVSRVRQGLESEISRTKVPAGAPERGAPDLSNLSPGEKIRYALGGNE